MIKHLLPFLSIFFLLNQSVFAVDEALLKKMPLPNKPEPIQLAPVPREEGVKLGGERLQSILDPDPEHFKSAQGQLAAQNLRWRAAFWVRCYRYTLRHAPLVGIGSARI